jgi:arylsulfatase A-like enzyme
MKFRINTTSLSKEKLFSASLILSSAASVTAQTPSNSTTPFHGVIGRTAAESQESWTENPKAPQGAPNVVWILLDDVGFGASSAFGGLIHTPNLENLANNGLRYTNFHTCAISAPTRAALLTGRNSSSAHMSGFGHISMSAGYPGWDGRIPSETGTIAEVLRENGYNTFAVGKWGLVPDWDATDAGPFDRWPSGKGFDHFFGFLTSQTDQYHPQLVEENAYVKTDGRHLSAQITDKAISYIGRQKAADPNKPFFLYYAPGAVHAPHQAPKEWIDKYKGQFDGGWDDYREKVIANQKKLGIIPANATLPDRHESIKAWAKLTPDERKVYARFMEVYAGYLEYTDYEIGRLVSYLAEAKQLDNTLIFVVVGDNGASKEGKQTGTNTALRRESGLSDDIPTLLSHLDEIGTANSSANYPLGWAQATNTPFKHWKQDANSEGGTHNPLIVYYPKGIQERGGIRNQYGHVIDLLPTTTEFVGIKQPDYIRGIKQDTIQGVSLTYSFNQAQAPSRHTLQHYYIFGSRAIYLNGWKAAAEHKRSLVGTTDNPSSISAESDNLDNDIWELYNLNNDFNEITDLAKKYPEKLAELKKLFEAQAQKYHLYPLLTSKDLHSRKFEYPEKLKNINK